ncbi:dihydroorotase [Corynebacterium uberis]|uniref:dihydroorotase n=1 Tax=Corynebacterium TaxID=1716 RepID=UPI001D0BD3EA|nr:MULTISPECIES: dihydroorotase [Corynebacterium]MCZ9309776.1 dihydroorotase [Corynebacterium sp. c6VSa_13]UDL73578.1 dihydroorotase [Corynebacterium uberis]UDL75542.1 dihydroorotase [Corynebacterium uberis]UDL77755.1 dihydroorotase [Corynebacterium uberis]UDL80038.1 dihydroorotase [Corynebacterium uberis]
MSDSTQPGGTSTENYPATGTTAPAFAGTVLLTNVRPYGEGSPVNVLITDGVISDLDASADTDADRTVDGHGGVLLPGLVDMHVHLREPGREETETIASGSAAAAQGGFTAVFTMANTQPVTDQPVIAEGVWYKGQQVGLCDVHPVGSITKGLEGKTLTEFGLMTQSDAKVRMFSDDGKCVENPVIMRRAIEYARGLDVLLAQHCEDPRLTDDATAHEGEIAGRLGLRGWPRAAEEAIIARDALLARDYGNRVHICHASTAGSVELLKWAKGQGIPMTAEVTPHHLLLSDELLETYDGQYRVNPPLRENSDIEALRTALLEGTIDCVASDHAPHSAEEKCCEFELARPGMLGLETSLAIIAEVFVKTGLADWRWVAKVMSERPAQITQLPDHGRPIAVGEPANLTVVDEDSPWTVSGRELASKASNTPYEGRTFNAKVTTTLLRGHVTCQDGAAAPAGTHTA